VEEIGTVPGRMVLKSVISNIHPKYDVNPKIIQRMLKNFEANIYTEILEEYGGADVIFSVPAQKLFTITFLLSDNVFPEVSGPHN